MAGANVITRWLSSGLVVAGLIPILLDRPTLAADSSLSAAVVTLQVDGGMGQRRPPSPNSLVPWLEGLPEEITAEGQILVPPSARDVLSGIKLQIGERTLILSVLDEAERQSKSLHLLVDRDATSAVAILAWDPASDLTLLELPADADGNPPSTSGDEQIAAVSLSDDPVDWGQPVRVLSQWTPKRPTLTAGIVSTVPRFEITAGAETFMTDAFVGPDARGSAVLNENNQLVGVLSKAAGFYSGRAPSTAIAIEPIRRLVEFVSGGGKGALPKARLGVSLEMGANGVTIASVDGSAAQQAGITPGDRIISINEQPVTLPEDVIAAVNRQRPGDTIELAIERGGESKKLSVTLGERPLP
ncbi:MAG: S1C family serine protease [Planctomycetaceae bacterium]